MDQEAIIQYIADTFDGLDVVRPAEGLGAGDTFIFYDPKLDLDPSHRLPFATIVTKNYVDFDEASQLDRPGVFRLNFALGREQFEDLFGHPPSAERIQSERYDYAALDRLMPHPAYGPQSWACVLNPTQGTFEEIKPLLAGAHARAAAQYARRRTSRG